MEYFDIEPKEPSNIALAFSGGGFRAATYSLGCLTYMETLQLGNEKFTSLVNFIASASGGTITNLLYTSAQRKKESFKDFYKKMSGEILKGDKLVSRVFEILRDKNAWSARPEKSRNLINAFAMVYDDLLFQGDTFEIYLTETPGAVAEVCANATEFDNGMLFRFQNAGDAGDRFLRFRRTDEARSVLQKIKLADILAASSCFPVGFEPIMFPVDFTHEHLENDELRGAMMQDTKYSPAKEEKSDKPPLSFGLMDGGIDDNQAIDSFILAESRLQGRNNFGYDLFMTCDVSSNYTSGFDFPVRNKKNPFLRLSLLSYVLFFFLLLVLAILGIIYDVSPTLSYALLGISILFTGLVTVLTVLAIAAQSKAKKEKNTFGILIFEHIGVFLKLRLSVLLQMIAARLVSTGELAGTVFLKKIRRISYNRIFEKITELKFKEDDKLVKDRKEEPLTSKIGLKHWSQFTIQNALYLLSVKNNAQRNQDLEEEKWFAAKPQVLINGKEVDLIDLMQPSPELQQVATLATEMDTTLWFDKNHIRDNCPAALLATGQFTTCYNLLRYAFRFEPTAFWKPIQERLASDWERFRQKPYWMYEEYEEK